MHDEIGAKELRHALREILDAMQANKGRVMILRNGAPIAGLVPPEELRALEQADRSRMGYHEARMKAKLREINWLKEGLDGARQEVQMRDE